MKDRHRGYQVAVSIPAGDPVVVKAGFAAVSITPDITDTWIESNHSFHFEPDKGDTFQDLTGTERFDAVWMAGFQNTKPRVSIYGRHLY